jgi:hypothetical protein
VQLGYDHFGSSSKDWQMLSAKDAPNTACTRPPAKCAGTSVVGRFACAFFGSLRGLKLVPSK